MKIKARVQAGLQTESLSLPIPLSFPPLLPGLLLKSYIPSWDSLGFWDWLADRPRGEEKLQRLLSGVCWGWWQGEKTPLTPASTRLPGSLVGCLHSSSSRRDVFFLRFPKISISLSSPLVTPLILDMTASLHFRHICVRVRVHTFWIFKKDSLGFLKMVID